jgi:glucosamine--fructose-6-phosphate aminotransferase (isomerizing)
LNSIANKIKNAYGSFLIGCGTAGYAALAGSYFFSKISRKHINHIVGSEFPSHQYFLTDKSLIIAISQSGETADTLEAVEVAKKKNSKVLGIVNVMGSSLMRYADYPLMTNAGPEICVCSTKAFTSQLSLLLLLSYAINNKLDEGKKLLLKTAHELKKLLDKPYLDNIKKLAGGIIKEKHQHIYVIGKAFNYPIALEAALKIKEVSYIHAEGFAAGELKHGVIALIEKGTPCIAIVANDEEKSAMLGSATELKSRGGFIIGIAPVNNSVFDYWIKVPDLGNASPIANVIPAQLLAYYLAVGLGLDPDKPRNLAKSVTVK